MRLKCNIKQLLLLLFLLFPVVASSQERKVMNRPYLDDRVWHYGFSLGLSYQDMNITNNGFPYINANGELEYWYADVASYTPGFSVGILGELKLSENLALRIIPTMYFGDKQTVYSEQLSGQKKEQIIKSTYMAIPFDVKVNAPRFNNYRPYLMAGLVPTVDLTVKKQKEILVKRMDCMFEIGMGMDLYYPFFKLIPELKFCFGLSDILVKDRKDLTDDTLLKYTQSISSIQNRMIVLTLYFE